MPIPATFHTIPTRPLPPTGGQRLRHRTQRARQAAKALSGAIRWLAGAAAFYALFLAIWTMLP